MKVETHEVNCSWMGFRVVQRSYAPNVTARYINSAIAAAISEKLIDYGATIANGQDLSPAALLAASHQKVEDINAQALSHDACLHGDKA